MPGFEFLERLEEVIRDRRERLPEGSYTAHLLRQGEDEILKKLSEEATEVVLASKEGDKGQIVYEAADLIYHLLVLLAYHDLSLKDVLAELRRRSK